MVDIRTDRSSVVETSVRDIVIRILRSVRFRRGMGNGSILLIRNEITIKNTDMTGKCNCGKKATSEWIVYFKDYATSMKFCDNCRPKRERPDFVKTYGK